MKKMFTTKSLRFGAVLMVLMCSVVFAGRLSAQAPVNDKLVGTNQSSILQGQAIAKQQHNWVTEQDAIAILQNAIEQGAKQLATLLPGSPQYQNLVFHITYYKLINNLLLQGNTTQSSVQLALDEMTAYGYGTDAPSQFTKNHLLNLYLEAVSMLAF
jgi:hypothetical protein